MVITFNKCDDSNWNWYVLLYARGSGISLGKCLANGRNHYNVTTPLIGWHIPGLIMIAIVEVMFSKGMHYWVTPEFFK